MKKKIFLIAVLWLISIMFISCDFFGTTTQTTQSITTSSATTSNNTITTAQTTIESTIAVATTTTATVTTTSATTTSATTTQNDNQPIIPTGYHLLQDELDFVGIPSQGDVKVLVFAVDFSDYPSFASDIDIADIEKAFNSPSDEIDFESLNSYYLKSSYGKLNLTADVYGFYRAEEPSSYYENEYEKLWAIDPFTGDWLYDDDEVTYPDSDIIYELLQYYDGQIDYSDYDANGDNLIDGIYVIYTHSVSDEGGSDLWWAYQDYFAKDDNRIDEYYVFDGVEPMYYSWSGTDFFSEGSDDINARISIHETGHMLGVDDYYDYSDEDNYNSGGLGGADMMDGTYGDHNPFSKMLLGWITPIVIEESMTVDITPFMESGEVILLIDHWNNTIFDEYILISYYTPLGLNEADNYWIFTIPGIVMYHVSAAIDNGYNEDLYYYSIFNNNNTDTRNMLIKIIEADMDNYIFRNSYSEDDDLFLEDDVFGETIYPLYRWYDNTYINVDVYIQYMDNEYATIEVQFDN